MPGEPFEDSGSDDECPNCGQAGMTPWLQCPRCGEDVSDIGGGE